MSDAYVVTVMAYSLEEFIPVYNWCCRMWGDTSLYQTWCMGWANSDLLRGVYVCDWAFQHKDDLIMFLLTWGHLVDSSQEAESCE
jgi:hypothetical protein